MKYPQLQDEYFKERDGVIAVTHIVNKMRCIWRETPNADVGIDGQIEYTDNDGNATGKMVAVQVKSGKSYLVFRKDDIAFSIQEKHRAYWENFPVPVILVIYDKEQDVAYWEDVRRALRSGSCNGKTLYIPKSQVFSAERKDFIFASCGTPEQELLDVGEIVAHMLTSANPEPFFRVSFFDLFAHGLTDSDDDGRNLSQIILFHGYVCANCTKQRVFRRNRASNKGGDSGCRRRSTCTDRSFSKYKQLYRCLCQVLGCSEPCSCGFL